MEVKAEVRSKVEKQVEASQACCKCQAEDWALSLFQNKQLLQQRGRVLKIHPLDF